MKKSSASLEGSPSAERGLCRLRGVGTLHGESKNNSRFVRSNIWGEGWVPKPCGVLLPFAAPGDIFKHGVIQRVGIFTKLQETRME